jgi:hypothetical protein
MASSLDAMAMWPARPAAYPIIEGGDAGRDETVNLALSNPDGGATLDSRGNAVVAIIDNDQAPEVNCTDRAEHIDGTADADAIHLWRAAM